MLCSVSGDKPTGSTWLDRLRSSKGLCSASDDNDAQDHLNLDHFLRRNHNNDLAGDPAKNGPSDSPPTGPIRLDRELVESPTEQEDGKDGEDGEWYGVMSNVLSELFNFGGSTRSSTISRKKFPRKQSNPRHCSVEVPNNVPVPEQRDPKCLLGVREAATTSLNSDNKKPAETRERRKSIVECDGVEEEAEEEKGERELVGYSKSEVTVIDTSFEVWKSEKLVFRRKNVWKVRDKKGKSRVVSARKKKKRKGNVGDEIVGRNKKMKVSSPVPDNAQTPRGHAVEVSEDTETDVNRVLERRLPMTSRKESSSGILTSKNCGPDARGPRSKAYKDSTKPGRETIKQKGDVI